MKKKWNKAAVTVPKRTGTKAKVNYRVRIEIDFDHVEDGCDGQPLPEDEQTYSVNQVIREDGTPLPYKEYCETYGDPDRYTGYNVDLERQCICCGEWKAVQGIATSLYLDDTEYIDEGTYALDKVPHEHLKELAEELLAMDQG